jgi:hypothetical protein
MNEGRSLYGLRHSLRDVGWATKPRALPQARSRAGRPSGSPSALRRSTFDRLEASSASTPSRSSDLSRLGTCLGFRCEAVGEGVASSFWYSRTPDCGGRAGRTARVRPRLGSRPPRRAEQIGIPATSRDLRHTCANLAVSADARVNAFQLILGDSSAKEMHDSAVDLCDKDFAQRCSSPQCRGRLCERGQ